MLGVYLLGENGRGGYIRYRKKRYFERDIVSSNHFAVLEYKENIEKYKYLFITQKV